MRRRFLTFYSVFLLITSLVLPAFILCGVATAADWAQVNNDGFGDNLNRRSQSMAVYGSYLYAGADNENTGCEVWRYDGSNWTQVNNAGFGDVQNWATHNMIVFNSYLYVGTANDVIRGGTGCELWRYDGSNWTQINSDGFGTTENIQVHALAVYGPYLYAGTTNSNTGCAVWETLVGYYWYLAEGSTGRDDRGAFQTWVLVQNPGSNTATVNLTYMTTSGPVTEPTMTLAPNTRDTVAIEEIVPNNWSVSTQVVSAQPVIAERAMYWNSAAGVYRQAAHDSIGHNE